MQTITESYLTNFPVADMEGTSEIFASLMPTLKINVLMDDIRMRRDSYQQSRDLCGD